VTSISDPGIVQVFDFGYHTDGSAFIVMEYLEGEALDRRLARLGRIAAPEAMLKLIGDATGTETQVVHGGAAPSLEVTTFEIAGNVLHAGDAGTLAVRVANRGAGTAYRVVATTRSRAQRRRSRISIRGSG